MPSRVETGHEIRKFDKDIDKSEFKTDILSNTCEETKRNKINKLNAIKETLLNTQFKILGMSGLGGKAEGALVCSTPA